METTAVARIPLALIQYGEEAGLNRIELLRDAGLREQDLRDPDQRVPESKLEDLWRQVLQAVPGRAVGLEIGSTRSLQDWGLVGCAMAYSRTLGEALRRYTRYVGIMNQTIVGTMNVRADLAEVIVDGAPRLDALRHPIDARCAVVVHSARKLTESDVAPAEAGFRYPQPANLAEHKRFFACPLRFDRPSTVLTFHRDDLERLIKTGDATLTRYLDQLADQTLESLGLETSFEEKVHRAIWSEMSGGAPTLARVAHMVGMSPRTLQRRLAEHGTTFASTLDAFRRETAATLLRDRSLAIYEVAFLLGYSEPSTFFRAFRRWHGESPRVFRRSLT